MAIKLSRDDSFLYLDKAFKAKKVNPFPPYLSHNPKPHWESRKTPLWILPPFHFIYSFRRSHLHVK